MVHSRGLGESVCDAPAVPSVGSEGWWAEDLDSSGGMGRFADSVEVDWYGY